MATKSYVISHRAGLYAVLAEGPRGGTRLIAVYTDQRVADSIAAELNRMRRKEA